MSNLIQRTKSIHTRHTTFGEQTQRVELIVSFSLFTTHYIYIHLFAYLLTILVAVCVWEYGHGRRQGRRLGSTIKKTQQHHHAHDSWGCGVIDFHGTVFANETILSCATIRSRRILLQHHNVDVVVRSGGRVAAYVNLLLHGHGRRHDGTRSATDATTTPTTTVHGTSITRDSRQPHDRVLITLLFTFQTSHTRHGRNLGAVLLSTAEPHHHNGTTLVHAKESQQEGTRPTRITLCQGPLSGVLDTGGRRAPRGPAASRAARPQTVPLSQPTRACRALRRTPRGPVVLVGIRTGPRGTRRESHLLALRDTIWKHRVGP